MQRKIVRRTQYNRWWKTRISKAIKVLDAIVAAPNLSESELNAQITKVQKELDKATKNGVIHKNKTNRIKSRLAKRINKMQNKQ